VGGGGAIKIQSQPAYNDHPWDPKKVGVVHRWPLFSRNSLKINFGCMGIRPVFVDRWLLFGLVCPKVGGLDLSRLSIVSRSCLD
jgi:hypothetical protein